VVNQDMCGYVCIARYSYTLQQIVGMALVKDYLSSEGAILNIYEDECEGRLIHADVVKMPFYDAQGKRLRM